MINVDGIVKRRLFPPFAKEGRGGFLNAVSNSPESIFRKGARHRKQQDLHPGLRRGRFWFRVAKDYFVILLDEFLRVHQRFCQRSSVVEQLIRNQ